MVCHENKRPTGTDWRSIVPFPRTFDQPLTQLFQVETGEKGIKYHNSHGFLFGVLLTGAKATRSTLWFAVMELTAKCFYPSEGNKVYWFFFFFQCGQCKTIVWMDGQVDEGWQQTDPHRQPFIPWTSAPFTPPRHTPSSQLHIRQQQPARLLEIEQNHKTQCDLLVELGFFFLSSSVTLQRKKCTNCLQLCVQTVWISNGKNDNEHSGKVRLLLLFCLLMHTASA